MITPDDLTLMNSKGISLQRLDEQLDRFAKGFPYLTLSGSATIGNGILKLDDNQEEQALARWNAWLTAGGSVTKFVPASGAASRMFKALFAFADGDTDTPAAGSDVDRLLADLDRLPFIEELAATTTRLYGLTPRALMDAGRNRDLIRAIIAPDGMNYGNLPKGLLSFHRYADGSVRTPLEEQLVEGAQTATAADGTVHLHFTVSANHRPLFEKKLAETVPAIADRMGVTFEISLSEQKPSTDTVAANADNTPFRDDQGHLVFRPGGHGALIENLNDLDSTVVFIKNIDNVVPDSLRKPTIRYKQVLAGVLVEAHDRIALYLDMLSRGNYDITDLRRMIAFMHATLNIRFAEMKQMEDAELALYIKSKLERPLRVCGMVKNEGEPGGGPYIAYNPDGTASPQILESTQIDLSKPENREMMASATHFNPVDLVCYTRDSQGRPFDLTKYVDEATGFISSKSFAGRELKALELPGLWNGAMSDWNTIFVEVPAATFNPVKTVNDLLRPTHAIR